MSVEDPWVEHGDDRSTPAELGETVAVARVDVAFVGAPQSLDDLKLWQAEADLVNRDGMRLACFHRAADVPAHLNAGLILAADQAVMESVRSLSHDAQVVVRWAGKDSAGLAQDLASRFRRRVAIAPLNDAERKGLASVLPERWLTLDDWSPLVEAQRLHASSRRRSNPALNVGVPLGGGSGFTVQSLEAAMSRAGAEANSARVVGVPTGQASAGLDVIILTDEQDEGSALARQALLEGILPVAPETAAADPAAPVLRVPWQDLPSELAALALDRTLWRGKLQAQAERALRRYGDGEFLGRIHEGPFRVLRPCLQGEPGRMRAPQRHVADVVLLGDFRRRDEVVEQALAQIRHHSAAGHRVVVAQVWNGKPGGIVHPGVEAAVRLGQAQIMHPADTVEAEAAVVIMPRLTIPALAVMRLAIQAVRWLVVENESATPDWPAAQLHLLIGRLYNVRPDWFAASGSARRALSEAVQVPVRPWPSAASPQSRLSPGRDGPRVVGIVAYAEADAEAALAAIGEADGALIHVLMTGTRRSFEGPLAPNCEVLGLDGTDVSAAVARFDVLLVPPGAPFERLPRRAVAEALALGINVLAAPDAAPALGAGPTYLPIADWPEHLVVSALEGATARRAAATARDSDLAAALGLPKRPPEARVERRRRPRVLFVTANGVGLGHVTRLAAIARRLPSAVLPVFATMSQAAVVLREMGFPFELLTSYTGKTAAAWKAATRDRMIEILDYHRPSVLVLDASNPYPGVLEAAACRPGIRLVWVRRGMWRSTQENSDFLRRAPYFDLVIEPRDIAETGQGLRPLARDVRSVAPIGLLDEEELLDRNGARDALGLAREAPGASVMIQLGSGTTRDLNTLLSQVVTELRRFDDVEIVLAQWLNAPASYAGRWPGIRLLSGYPIPRYYRAFDFTISAAGYNSYNDLLRFGVPTVFIANDAECMDDQGARARHAEFAEAAFDLQETDLAPLGGCVEAMLQPAVRNFMSARAREIALPNGAADAAAAIAECIA